jgi:sugar-specific transcriptional regulator TrmB
MENELKQFGLSDKEVKVYLATLKLGSAPVVRITKATGIARATIYDTLNSLISKGLVKSFKKEKKMYYDAIRPKIILEQQKQKELIIKKILPQLESVAGKYVEKPTVEVFEGKKGVQALLEEVYDEKELLVYGSAKKSAAAFKHLPENFARKRISRNIKLRAVLEHSKEAIFRITDPDIKKITKVKFLNKMQDIPTVTFIFGKKIAILTLERELVGIKIEDPSVNTTQRVIFESFWNLAKQ